PALRPGTAEPDGCSNQVLSALLRRLGGSRRSGGGRLRPFLDDSYRPDRPLVEKEQRDGKREHADQIGRGEEGGKAGNDQDSVAALAAQLVGGDEPDAAQQGEDD